jgi:hypothetical protein
MPNLNRLSDYDYDYDNDNDNDNDMFDSLLAACRT